MFVVMKAEIAVGRIRSGQRSSALPAASLISDGDVNPSGETAHDMRRPAFHAVIGVSTFRDRVISAV